MKQIRWQLGPAWSRYGVHAPDAVLSCPAPSAQTCLIRSGLDCLAGRTCAAGRVRCGARARGGGGVREEMPTPRDEAGRGVGRSSKLAVASGCGQRRSPKTFTS